MLLCDRMAPRKENRKRIPPAQRPAAAAELVDPRWLLRAFLIAVAVALVCGYLALGYLFAQGAWQLLLHPTRLAQPAAIAGGEAVRFAPDESGQAQIAGDWLSPQPSGRLHAYAFLICRGGDGQLGLQDQPAAELLQSTGAAALFFDYRGFGQSVPVRHPSEATMTADTEAAWHYLTENRKVGGGHVILYGEGVGAVLAARMAAAHPEAAALVLRNADADAFSRVLADPRGRMFPVRLLLRDRFDLDGALSAVHTPKLLISAGPDTRARVRAYTRAPEPKLVVHVDTDGSGKDSGQERDALSRFAGDRIAP